MNRSEWEQKCAQLRAHYTHSAQSASSLADLESIRVQCLGRKGALTELLKALKDFPLEDKKILGPMGNSLKDELSAIFDGKTAEMTRAETDRELGKTSVDLTLPPFPAPQGHLHPLTLAARKMSSILSGMGFAWAEGGCIETDYFNFEALNFPPDHPARDMQDTFYLKTQEGGVPHLLRTHTSPVQIRYMKANKPPLRIMAPGRVFRNDAVDASHSAVFQQIEGLYVDRNVSMADLKSTLTQFMRGLFGPEVTIRFRPSFFPFVEPGVEVDCSCSFCKGKGKCPVCKSTGWIEMLGAGLVHPNVLRAVDIDPEQWTGFAFGMGVERLAMLKFGMNDIRNFYTNDLRILKQF